MPGIPVRQASGESPVGGPFAAAPCAKTPDEGASQPSPLRILVVEDHADAAEMLRMLLSLSGHLAETASTGAEAIEVASRLRPDVVLCDISLPGGLDGYAVARAIRSETPEPPLLVALTGYGRDEVHDRCIEAGFDLQLTKPVDCANLLKVISGLVPRR
jgi:CheY-like chemotaxis protein